MKTKLVEYEDLSSQVAHRLILLTLFQDHPQSSRWLAEVAWWMEAVFETQPKKASDLRAAVFAVSDLSSISTVLGHLIAENPELISVASIDVQPKLLFLHDGLTHLLLSNQKLIDWKLELSRLLRPSAESKPVLAAYPRQTSIIRLVDLSFPLTDHLILLILESENENTNHWLNEAASWLYQADAYLSVKGGKRLKKRDLDNTIFALNEPRDIRLRLSRLRRKYPNFDFSRDPLPQLLYLYQHLSSKLVFKSKENIDWKAELVRLLGQLPPPVKIKATASRRS